MTDPKPTNPTMYCRKCRYPLDGLSENRCPECGEPFNPADPSTYFATDRPLWRRIVTRRHVKITAAVLLGVYILGTIWGLVAYYPVKQEWIYMDTVTGSKKYETLLVFGPDPKPLVKPSELELWLVRREGKIQHNWRRLRGEAENIWGGYVSSGPHAGGEGGIYIGDLAIHDDLLNAYVADSTDEQKAQFIQTMRYGTFKEKQLAVDGAVAMALNAYGKYLREKRRRLRRKP